MPTRQGFTLVEVMVVVVIISIIAAITIPHYMNMQSRAKEASIKSNAHSLQLAVEAYGVIHDTELPALADLTPDMFPGNALPANPLTGSPISIEGPGFSPGNLGYSITGVEYFIEAYGVTGTSGMNADGIILVLSNG